MKKKVLWIALLALLTLLPFGSVKADGAPLLIAPGPAAESDKPFWYPQDTSNFQFFTDATAPRVADYADIFTDEEEAAILQAIGTQSARGGADIVVVTDSSSYGMSHREYADDFYDYNGYGFGKDSDGIVLFICMEAGNLVLPRRWRSGWQAVTYDTGGYRGRGFCFRYSRHIFSRSLCLPHIVALALLPSHFGFCGLLVSG